MHSLWRVTLGLVVGFIAIIGLVGTVETFVQQSALRESSAKKDDTIANVTADLRDVHRRLDKLSDRNAALVELLRKQGADVPASLVNTRTHTRTVERDRDNDSDDGDAVIVTPNQPAAASSQPTTSPSSSPSRVEVPKADLPEPIGEATDDIKDMGGELVPVLP